MVKNLWDFKEIVRRGPVPTTKEFAKTRSLIEQIQTTARKFELQEQLFAK
jgi:hypothetical protein